MPATFSEMAAGDGEGKTFASGAAESGEMSQGPPQEKEDEVSAPQGVSASREEAPPYVPERPKSSPGGSLDACEAENLTAERARLDAAWGTRLEAMQAATAAWHARLDRHLSDTASCSQQAFDRLYEEMRRYKDNYVMELRRELLSDIMALYDDLAKLAAFYQTVSQVEPAEVVANLEGLAIEAEEMLERRGVFRMVEEVRTLDRRRQRAVQTEPTVDPAEDLRVVRRVRAGFLWGERPFRPEDVVILRYQKPREDQARDVGPSGEASDGPQQQKQTGRQ